jgi:hypothetical protein
MGRTAWIGAGIAVATLIAIVVNLATSGGAWWLWPILAVLVVAAIAIEVYNRRVERRSAHSGQEITATGGAQVVDSPQSIEASGGEGQQRIVARRWGVVRRSGQYRRR